MKCRLCDRPTATGTGKLCTDCAKALRRARGAALAKLGPATSPAAELASAAPITFAITPPAPVARQGHRRVLWASVGLGVIAAVYFGQRELMTTGSEPAGTNRPEAMTERVNVEPVPVVTRVEEPSWTVPDAARTEAESDPLQNPVPAVKAPASGVAKPGRLAKSESHEGRSIAPPVPAQHDVATARSGDVDAEQPLASGKAASPAQPVDSGQVLASAMQKCGNESLISRFICEQKTYMQYCEDKWDKDPKCMRKVGER